MIARRRSTKPDDLYAGADGIPASGTCAVEQAAQIAAMAIATAMGHAPEPASSLTNCLPDHRRWLRHISGRGTGDLHPLALKPVACSIGSVQAALVATNCRQAPLVVRRDSGRPANERWRPLLDGSQISRRNWLCRASPTQAGYCESQGSTGHEIYGGPLRLPEAFRCNRQRCSVCNRRPTT